MISIIWGDHIFSQTATDFINDKNDDFVTVIDGDVEYKFHKELIHSIVITSY